MNPYPYPNSVLIMDNCSIHHGGRVAELAEARGVRLLYLPPYSPDFNPLVAAFLLIEYRLQLEGLNLLCENSVYELVSTEECHKLYRSSGYRIIASD